MPEARVRMEPRGETIAAEVGTPLRDLLFTYGVEFPCGGESRCKRCRVRVVQGQLDGGASVTILPPREYGEGWRLACRSSVEGHVTLEIGQWESNILSDDSAFHFVPKSGLGIAVDVGTTTLV